MLDEHAGSIVRVSCTPTMVTSMAADCTIRVWDRARGTEVNVISLVSFGRACGCGHCGPVGVVTVGQWVWSLLASGCGHCGPVGVVTVDQWVWSLWASWCGRCGPVGVVTVGQWVWSL